MKVTRFEQSGLVLDVGSSRHALDLGSHTSTESVATIGDAAASIVSHIHPDHFQPAHLLMLSGPVFGPAEAVTVLAEVGIAAHTIHWGHETSVGALKLLPVACDHGSLSCPVENMGFLIRADGATIYTVGDMARPSGTPDLSCDAVFIPVGGGKVFTPEHALAYLRTLRLRGPVVPVHYHGSADPAAGVDFQHLAGDEFDVRVLDPGESIEVNG
jgi:L-ascorbate metabolism protein UlaG (beta-lactamase superfamily)